MTEQPEALRLAYWLERDGANCQQHINAAAELRRLAAVEAQRDALLEALKGITPPMPPADAPCHVGLVPQEKCAHCGRIARARAAIRAVEGENT